MSKVHYFSHKNKQKNRSKTKNLNTCSVSSCLSARNAFENRLRSDSITFFFCFSCPSSRESFWAFSAWGWTVLFKIWLKIILSYFEINWFNDTNTIVLWWDKKRFISVFWSKLSPHENHNANNNNRIQSYQSWLKLIKNMQVLPLL